jgi:fructose-1-phosphate kinase PfkB-like protein
VEPHLVPVEAATRRNVTLLVEGEDTIAPHFVAPGFALADGSAIDQLYTTLAADILPGDIVIFSGSLPDGADPATWARLGAMVHSLAASVLLDIQGEALLAALEAVPCWVCKPNVEEASALAGDAAGPEQGRLLAALGHMLAGGVRLPVITLGSRGLVFASEGRLWEAWCPVDRARLVVGAGDALMAGMAVAVEQGLPDGEVVRFALCVAAAHVEGRQGRDLAFRAAELAPRVEIREGPRL